MENAKKVYRWVENWDGGVASEYFDTPEEAKADAIKHVQGIRWTAKEFKDMIRQWGQDGSCFVLIETIYLDEDGDEVGFEDDGDAVLVNESTVDRVY
jgi:hypothetical protein